MFYRRKIILAFLQALDNELDKMYLLKFIRIVLQKSTIANKILSSVEYEKVLADVRPNPLLDEHAYPPVERDVVDTEIFEQEENLNKNKN